VLKIEKTFRIASLMQIKRGHNLLVQNDAEWGRLSVAPSLGEEEMMQSQQSQQTVKAA